MVLVTEVRIAGAPSSLINTVNFATDLSRPIDSNRHSPVYANTNKSLSSNSVLPSFEVRHYIQSFFYPRIYYFEL